MASRLKSILTVTALAPSASVTVPHYLNVSSGPRTPDRIDRGVLGTLEFSAVNDLTITITNTGADPVTGRVLAEVWGSAERVLGGLAALPGGAFVTGGSVDGGGGGDGTVETDGVTITGDGSVGDPLTVPVSDALVLVADTYSFVEDVVGALDLFANDLPVGEWVVHGFRVPAADLSSPPTEHYPSATAVSVPAHGSIILNVDGTGTWTPSANVHGAVPTILITARGPNGHLRYSTLSITVTPVNDPPVARDISGISIYDPVEDTRTNVTIDFSTAMSDPDGDAVNLVSVGGVPVVYGTPMDLDGGTITINATTLLGTVVIDADRADPIDTSYVVTDGTLTATASINIVIAEVPNNPMISPIAPLNPANIHDVARLGFFQTYMQEYGPLWPYIGPPDGGGNMTLVTQPPYGGGQGAFVLTTQEPWLYNRVRVAYLMWKATGNPEYRDVAILWCEMYFGGMGSGGSWNIGTVDPQDAKYKYPENADFYFELTADRDGTGSTVYYGNATALYTAMKTSFLPEYDAGSDELWTERNTCYALRAHMRQFYRTGGDPAILAEAAEYVAMILEMSAATGAPLHGHNKHEGSAITTPISSPWMTGFLVEDMLQYYRHTRDEDVLAWIYNYGLWVVNNALYVADHNEEPEFAGLEGLRLSAYLAGTGIQFPEGTAADMRHARDVAVLLAKAVWAGSVLGEDVTDLVAAADELFEAALVDDAYWTRTTLLYAWKRSNPPRSHAWMYAHFYALIYDTGFAPPIAPVVLTVGAISGSSQQGQTLTFTPGTSRGTPTPTVTWIWQVGGVDVAGTDDDLTYVSAGTGAHTVRVTIENEAETVEYSTNTITVVPAGTPTITVQPTNQSAVVGAQATFTVTATGTPSPNYQWRRNTGGAGLANVTQGTGGTTNSHTTEVLAAPDDGDTFEVVVSNINGSVTSDLVTLSMVVQQPAIQFLDSTDFAQLTHTFGGTGFIDWTVAGWFRRANVVNSASWLTVEGAASRRGYNGYNNSGVPSLGDSNTGSAGGTWDVVPPLNTWFFMVWRGATTWPGTFTATWYNQDGTLGGTATRANGIENSLTPNIVWLNGGDAIGCSLRAQHVRGYDRRLSDAEALAEVTNINLSTPNLRFFNVFEDVGAGPVARDATGNGRVFTLTGVTITSDGPLTGTV